MRPALVVGIVLGSFRSAVADWNDVPSGSMKPTILEGDRIFVNKLAYDLKVPFTTWSLARWSEPERGDIVVLWSPHDGKRLVKRVVAIPGDRLEVVDQRLVINGEPAHYAPVSMESIREQGLLDLPAKILAAETVGPRTHLIMTGEHGPTFSIGPLVVPAGGYFVMGDHRDMSFDSRWFGFVERKRIVGRASAVVVSFDGAFYRLRWYRSFTSLH